MRMQGDGRLQGVLDELVDVGCQELELDRSMWRSGMSVPANARCLECGTGAIAHVGYGHPVMHVREWKLQFRTPTGQWLIVRRATLDTLARFLEAWLHRTREASS